eukprot:SAG31_NODE_1230_length_9212_cov_3.669264_2_plen_175_part_00
MATSILSQHQNRRSESRRVQRHRAFGRWLQSRDHFLSVKCVEPNSVCRASSGTAATPAKKAVVPDKAKIFKQITTVDKGIGDLLTIDVKPTGDKVVLSEQQAKIFKQITTVDKGIGGMLTLGWKPTDDKVVLSNPDQWTMPKASTQLRGQELIEAAIRGAFCFQASSARVPSTT